MSTPTHELAANDQLIRVIRQGAGLHWKHPDLSATPTPEERARVIVALDALDTDYRAAVEGFARGEAMHATDRRLGWWKGRRRSLQGKAFELLCRAVYVPTAPETGLFVRVLGLDSDCPVRTGTVGRIVSSGAYGVIVAFARLYTRRDGRSIDIYTTVGGVMTSADEFPCATPAVCTLTPTESMAHVAAFADPLHRADALLGLLPHLDPQERPQALQRAAEAVVAVEKPAQRLAMVMAVIALAPPQSELIPQLVASVRDHFAYGANVQQRLTFFRLIISRHYPTARHLYHAVAEASPPPVLVAWLGEAAAMIGHPLQVQASDLPARIEEEVELVGQCHATVHALRYLLGS